MSDDYRDDWGLADDYDAPWSCPTPRHLVDIAERQRLNRLFDAILDEEDPGWRERKRKAREESDMLWRNQRITHLRPEERAALNALSAWLHASNAQAEKP